MKIYSTIVIAALALSGCVLLPQEISPVETIKKMAEETAVEKTESAISTAAGEENNAAKASESETAAPHGEAIEVSEENVTAAVKAFDLEKLEALLGDVEDIRTVVSPEVLLLHMAEEAMGMGGMENPMTRLLVEKKAWILQRDDRGMSFVHIIDDLGLSGTPRQQYARDIIGDKFDRYWKALRSDSVSDLQSVEEWIPLEDRVMLDAAHEKAPLVAAYLLERGVSAHGVDPKNGETGLHKVCNNFPYTSVFDDRKELLGLFLDEDVDVNGENAKGETPLVVLLTTATANYGGKLGSPADLAQKLVDYGAAVNRRDSKGQSLVYLAANSHYDKTLELLLEAGAEMDPQAVSAVNGSGQAAKLFLEYGADPELVADRISAFTDPAEQREFIELLLEKELDPAAIDPQKLYANFDNVKYLLERGGSLSGSNILASSVLQFTDLDRISYLLDHGADIGKRYYGERTILHMAVSKGNLEVTALLIDRGAEVNVLDGNGKTPLDLCHPRKAALHNLLTEKGAKPGDQL